MAIENVSAGRTLLENLKRTAEERQEELRREYCLIVRRSAAPHEGDAARLAEIINELKIDMPVVEQDVLYAGQVHLLETEVGRLDNEEAELQCLTEEEKAVGWRIRHILDAVNEQEEMKTLRTRRTELNRKINELRDEVGEHRRMATDLARLKQRSDLWQDEDREST